MEKVSQYKYLGTIVKNTGSFKTNEINLKQKGLRASYLISKIALHAKPSSSIKIYEKIVEPILMYNCEVSLAYLPKCWTYEKFIKNMWEIGGEVNKVTLSFLRQMLGVHKKTPNLAILGETGKFPISINIFIHIIKYWFRLSFSENKLLEASKEANLTQDHLGRQNWYKIVKFLLKATSLNDIPVANENEAGKIITKFKEKIKMMYRQWWLEKMMSVENRKLEFFFKYKKTFLFEKYLDALPRHIRLYSTRLRTSSHAFPIETLRYMKPKIEAHNRKCTICDSDETGDEMHYLTKCNNAKLLSTKNNFLINIKQTITEFDNFNLDDIIQYCLLMHDTKTIAPMAEYVKKILITYREETNKKKTEAPIITRCGRLVKKPVRLDL